ncbi:MAG: hypothetical protein Q8N13_10945 [Acidovorax sp.]|nr:hypothetical protein [Acidovorax sp.]
MQFHKQLFHHKPEEGIYGDCHRTAIACVLDKAPQDVPDFGVHFNDGKQFESAVKAYLETQNLFPFSIAFPPDLPALLEYMGNINPGVHYLLSGRSKTGVNHSVVCLGNAIIWDPSLTDAGIVGPCDDGYFWVLVLAQHNAMKSSKPADVPGATLEWFTDLRKIIHDNSQELRNRLQAIDSRVHLLSGAPCPVRTEQEEREEVAKQTPQAIIEAKARDLAALADALGLNVTIERRPVPGKPLAMGNGEAVISVWLARVSA